MCVNSNAWKKVFWPGEKWIKTNKLKEKSKLRKKYLKKLIIDIYWLEDNYFNVCGGGELWEYPYLSQNDDQSNFCNVAIDWGRIPFQCFFISTLISPPINYQINEQMIA